MYILNFLYLKPLSPQEQRNSGLSVATGSPKVGSDKVDEAQKKKSKRSTPEITSKVCLVYSYILYELFRRCLSKISEGFGSLSHWHW